MANILITGALGQVGSELIDFLLASYSGTIYATDIHKESTLKSNPSVKYAVLDVRNREMVENIIGENDIDEVYHLASILSASGEKDPYMAYNVNLTGTVNVLNASVTRGVKKVFIPSTIGVFGPEVQKEKAPRRHASIPTTIYGITKAAGEMLFQYYYNKYNIDVRSLRYPGLLSYKVAPTAGTTDYAVDMIKHAASGNSYECYLKDDTRLPMMYMPDAMSSTLHLMTAPAENIRVRTSYNVMSYSFTPRELENELRELNPEFRVVYKPDFRQSIADSWPWSIDVTDAVNDWEFKPVFDLKNTVSDMFQNYRKFSEKLNPPD